jgi:hypothetical protein
MRPISTNLPKKTSPPKKTKPTLTTNLASETQKPLTLRSLLQTLNPNPLPLTTTVPPSSDSPHYHHTLHQRAVETIIEQSSTIKVRVASRLKAQTTLNACGRAGQLSY